MPRVGWAAVAVAACVDRAPATAQWNAGSAVSAPSVPPWVGPSSRPPVVIRPPSVGPAGDGVWLARWFEVEVDRPAALVLTVRGPDLERRIAFPGRATHHRVPLLELRAATTYHVEAELDGVMAAAVRFTTAPLPPGLPNIDAEALDPERMEPGLTLFPLVDLTAGVGWLVALDRDGEIVHLREVPALTTAVTVTRDGGFALNEGGSVAVYDPMGGVRRRWTAAPSAPEDLPVAHPDLHHEMVLLDDGSWFSLTRAEIAVDAYPTSYDDPFDYAPATIRADTAVHVAADGTTLATYPLSELLDTRRIGYDALDGEVPDWSHANGLFYDGTTDALLISTRHQDAVVAVDRASGAIRWIFGHPYGWPDALAPLVLRATAPIVWPTHQHAVEIDADGTLRVFDNGCDHRDTPYHDSGQEGGEYSRILEVRVDEAAGTVTPAGEYVETSDGPLFSRALGNADRLPQTGNRLGTWGYAPRIVEFAPDGTVVFEVTAPAGWRTDRAIRVPTLYARPR